MGGRVVNVNCSAARRWNYLLPPRSSKGRYRSPTGPLVVPVSMKTVRPRCPPGKNAGLAPLAASAARSGPLRCMRMHSRTKMTSAAGDTALPRVAYRRQKPEFPADDFLGQSRVLSHRNAACAGARLSFLLAGVEAASPRGIYN